jgi:hypothetical protein
MQTFLPYSDFQKSAECLDYRRLGKQRIETMQLLRVTLGTSNGWSQHPAAKMWRGHSRALCEYGMVMCREWIRRGYKDTQLPIFENIALPVEYRLPSWIGDEAFHASHRSNLLRKFPEHYSTFGWTESPDLPYIWPIPETITAPLSLVAESA